MHIFPTTLVRGNLAWAKFTAENRAHSDICWCIHLHVYTFMHCTTGTMQQQCTGRCKCGHLRLLPAHMRAWSINWLKWIILTNPKEKMKPAGSGSGSGSEYLDSSQRVLLDTKLTGWMHLWVGRRQQNLKRCFRATSSIETVSPEGIFCDTVQVPSGAGDMQLI